MYHGKVNGYITEKFWFQNTLKYSINVLFQNRT